MRLIDSFRSAGSMCGHIKGLRVCAIAGLVAIALAGCATAPQKPKAPPPPPPQTAVTVPSNLLSADQPQFLRLGNMQGTQTPVRVGIILPFTNGSAATRQLAAAMMKSAELALFDSHNPNILLMSADEGSTPGEAANAARQLLNQGAEIIVGPLFSQSVQAVAPLARERGVPVVAFSTDSSVAGDGVYLLSFQPENEVKRIVDYAVSQGHSTFAALVPATPYGVRVEQTLKNEVALDGATIGTVERFTPDADAMIGPAQRVAASGADAILVAQGGSLLRGIAPTLTITSGPQPQLLGTGVWDDPTITQEASLSGAWFAAPAPYSDDGFQAKYKAVFDTEAPQLATLPYDAISLISLLAPGQPYHRFTREALSDPNGFAGINGIFRFNPDGTSDRGLAILSVRPGGFVVVNPAPSTFEKPQS